MWRNSWFPGNSASTSADHDISNSLGASSGGSQSLQLRLSWRHKRTEEILTCLMGGGHLLNCGEWRAFGVPSESHALMPSPYGERNRFKKTKGCPQRMRCYHRVGGWQSCVSQRLLCETPWLPRSCWTHLITPVLHPIFQCCQKGDAQKQLHDFQDPVGPIS